MTTNEQLPRYTETDRSDHEIAKARLAHLLSGRGYEDRLSGRELAERTPVSASTVRDELVELERAGFVYRAGAGASAEVRLP